MHEEDDQLQQQKTTFIRDPILEMKSAVRYLNEEPIPGG